MLRHACLILCKSVHHGNTARVAEAMAGVLGATVASPEERPASHLDAYELIGFGSGIYYGRMHQALFDWLSGLPDSLSHNRRAFVFSTSGLPFLAGVWHWPLRRMLVRKGFPVVGAFACRGFDTWGPLWLAGGLNRKHPDDRDLERARCFAAGIADKVWPVETAA
jgi:flavodoxin